MGNEPDNEKMSEPESEILNLEEQDLNNTQDKSDETKIEIETISTNPDNPERENNPRACEEDPYIVKLFKSLMKPESQKSLVEKKK